MKTIHMKKICKKCNKNRDISLFCKSSANKDGLQSYCKICMRKIRKKSYKKNKKVNSERAKKYYIDNKEKILAKIKEYHSNNYNRINEQRKIYYQLNKHKINKKQNLRYQTDINYRIRKSLGSRLSETVRGEYRSTSVKKLIGCSIDELIIHLESKFYNGMTWENYGLKGWHIDHIKPCSSFNLTELSQQKKCFNYTNLQPLWAIDNLKKSNKIL